MLGKMATAIGNQVVAEDGETRPRLRVILADDSLLARRTISHFLQGLEHVELCAVCEDGHKAVEAALRHQPDLAILDMQMPVLGGMEAARIFRSSLPAMAIIMMSLHDQPEIRAACLNSGADAFVAKSALTKTFDKVVATALDATRLPNRHFAHS